MKLFFTLFFIALLSLISCTDNKKNKDIDTSPLIFLHYWSGDINGGIDSMVSEFNQQETDFEIKATGYDHESFKISMKVMMAGGNPPDLFSYWAGARTGAFAKRGYLADVDSIWNAEGLDTVFSEAISEASSYRGKKYLIPVTQHYIAFFYNKSIFNSLEVTPPTSWSEFIDLSIKLKENEILPISLGSENRWPVQFWFDFLLLRTAGSEYRTRLMNGNASYTDPEVIQVFELWKSLIDMGIFNDNHAELDWALSAELVGNNGAAMTLMGTWITGYFDSKLQLEQDKDYGYFSFPVIDSSIEMSALGPVDGILLPAQSDNERTRNVLSLFANADVQRAMSTGSGAISPSTEVTFNDDKPVQRSIEKELQNYSQWAFNYDLATPPEMADIGLDLFGKFLESPESYLDLLEETEKLKNELSETVWE